MKQALAAMQKSFPSLTELAVHFFTKTEFLVIPDLFLRGSAPLLRSLQSECVLFPLPVLRNLLKSPDLVQIRIGRFRKDPFHPRTWSLAFPG
ncbi:hypothetical protein BGY98DRAFT_1053014 [Russula aff. rugulosa BPL654]|nr:hypothetical protein BGY98DRAFT_1053014 [Russula aff. rugulosa BPL654]